MQPNSPNTTPAQHRSGKKSILSLFRRPKPSSPLKQRMEEVLKQDRRAINDPYAHLKATYFAD